MQVSVFDPEYWKMFRSMILEQPLLFSFFVFILGSCIGSFLNVCIYRIPNGMSLLYPPSHCPNCDHKIQWYENIPMLSFLGLRGRCSGCHTPISPRYFYVEMLTGLLYTGLFLGVIFGRNEAFHLLPLYFMTAAILICNAFTDVEYRVIPNSLNITLLLTGLANAAWKGWLFAGDGNTYQWSYIIVSLSSCAAVGGALWLFAMLTERLMHRETFGMGDVKYMGAVAACFADIPAILILMFACVTAVSGVGIYRLFDKRRNGRLFAFGPFISAGVLLWMFIGNAIENLWLKVFPDFPMIFFGF